jgi:hypothetical protein
MPGRAELPVVATQREAWMRGWGKRSAMMRHWEAPGAVRPNARIGREHNVSLAGAPVTPAISMSALALHELGLLERWGITVSWRDGR